MTIENKDMEGDTVEILKNMPAAKNAETKAVEQTTGDTAAEVRGIPEGREITEVEMALESGGGKSGWKGGKDSTGRRGNRDWRAFRDVARRRSWGNWRDYGDHAGKRE